MQFTSSKYTFGAPSSIGFPSLHHVSHFDTPTRPRRTPVIAPRELIYQPCVSTIPLTTSTSAQQHIAEAAHFWSAQEPSSLLCTRFPTGASPSREHHPGLTPRQKLRFSKVEPRPSLLAPFVTPVYQPPTSSWTTDPAAYHHTYNDFPRPTGDLPPTSLYASWAKETTTPGAGLGQRFGRGRIERKAAGPSTKIYDPSMLLEPSALPRDAFCPSAPRIPTKEVMDDPLPVPDFGKLNDKQYVFRGYPEYSDHGDERYDDAWDERYDGEGQGREEDEEEEENEEEAVRREWQEGGWMRWRGLENVGLGISVEEWASNVADDGSSGGWA
ncbi:hypothetical protein BCR39DRAFT_531336 [Naematelia encephala]|uniref:Uncharacterized protein n=1 Tax=Naematelia encephala TaxID=71784 RepID=A0A1Y2B480_9TREE|nr:hypothetical protein BCR39DRAFT_531336 [Naematelia encephala]